MQNQSAPKILNLPIDSRLAEIQNALSKSNTLILQASPGTGKTTRVPPALLQLINGKIIVLQPRRIAARMAAQRIADELGEECGKTVGYRVRFEKSVSEKTRIEFLTEGLFLRQIQENPKLPGIGCVILDEFHERHIHTDTALALVRRLQLAERSDLKLILMSATLPSEELKASLQNAATIAIEAKMFPIRIDYTPEKSVPDAVLEVLDEDAYSGHILAFLPGARDIAQVESKLQGKAAAKGFRLFVLHGSMSLQEQRQVFLPSSERKVILATNIAETSVTIDGVTGVVDSGVAKISGFANWSGLQTLSTRPVSQAACIQRAGRAGRTRPGVVKRLYSELDYTRRQPFEKAEIHRTDLTPLVLELKNLSARFGKEYTMENLPWFEKPDGERIEVAGKLLTYLGAIDERGEITALGKEMARLPMHPRLARIALEGKKQGCPGAAVLAAAALSENYIQPNAEQKEKVDFCTALIKLQRTADFRFKKVLEHFAADLGMNVGECLKPFDETKLTLCLFKGFCDRVEKSGTKNKSKEDEFILALDAQENPYAKGRAVTIRVAAPIATEILLDGPEEFLRASSEIIWDEARQKVRKVSRLYYGDHRLEEKEEEASFEETQPLLEKALVEHWPKPFGDVSELDQMRSRIAMLKVQKFGPEFPDLEEPIPKALVKAICTGRTSFAEILKTSFSEYLELMLEEAARKLLREMAPTQMSLTPKRRTMIHYEQGKPPWIESRIQDFFGMSKTPTICGGRVQLVLHLLAPNGRAEQVTTDLAAFWQNIYPKLRSSLGRRYPRHPWPENPLIKPPSK